MRIRFPGTVEWIGSWYIALLCWAALGTMGTLAGEPPTLTTVDAPPLGKVGIGKREDLGVWDDVLLPRESESIYLRRGTRLFSFSPGIPPELVERRDLPELATTELKFTTGCEGRPWLFLVPRGAFPFALDLARGTKVEFRIPGMTVGAGAGLELQSWVISPHDGRLLLMLSGGDAKGWPRSGNRPVYFWVDLRSGATRCLPLGWELMLTSGDLSLAAFLVQPGSPDIPAALLGGTSETAPPPEPGPKVVWLDLRDGKDAAAPAWDERNTLWNPFDWQCRDTTRWLVKGAFWGGREFAGVSVKGVVHPLSLPVSGNLGFGWNAEVREGWGRLGRRDDRGSVAWVTSLVPDSKPVLVGTNVFAIELLADGRCVQVSPLGMGVRDRSWWGARVTDVQGGGVWNVLEGVADAPVRGPDIPYVSDEMSVRLERGVGDPGQWSGVMCLVSHHQMDRRAGGFREPQVPTSRWWGAVLVSDAGKRFQVKGYDASVMDRWAWYHNGGTLVLAGYDPKERGKRVRVLSLGGE